MVFHDVTQRRRAERALRANEDRLRDSARRLQLAMSASELGDWVWDAETNLMSLSPRAAQLFRLPANAPVSRDQLRALVPPEDGLRTKLEFDRALLERTDYKVDFRILRGGVGPPIWVAARGRGVYADHGAVVGMIGMVQDITERRQAEELRGRLAAVVESSTDAVISKTLESVITTWNQGAERLFGYKAEEVIGKPITIIIPPDHADEEPAILERIKSGEPVEPFQTVRRRKDGTLVNVSLAVSPIRDAHGRIIGASKIARDITAEKLAEGMLRETDRRKDEFLATLAHELRNPLAPIRQATLIAQSPNATEAQKRWSHDVIIRQVHNMALLLDDLLDISRITRGTLALRTQPTDLASVIAAAVETARPLIDAKRHALSVQLPTERVEFAADPMRLAAGAVQPAHERRQVHGPGRAHRPCGELRGRRGDDQRDRYRHRHSGRRHGQSVRNVLASEIEQGPFGGRIGDRSGAREGAGGAARWHNRGAKRGYGTRQRVHHPAAATRTANQARRHRKLDLARREPCDDEF